MVDLVNNIMPARLQYYQQSRVAKDFQYKTRKIASAPKLFGSFMARLSITFRICPNVGTFVFGASF